MNTKIILKRFMSTEWGKVHIDMAGLRQFIVSNIVDSKMSYETKMALLDRLKNDDTE